MPNCFKNKIGFTLIELLIVIAIIGILSTATAVSLNQAKAKARDARRLADITQIKKALEVYYYTVGEYPNADECYTLPAVCICTSFTANPITAWIPDLTNYIDQPLPIDPLNDADENGSAQHVYIFTRLNGLTNPSYKDYYYILYRTETIPLKDECYGYGYAGWSCTGGGTMPR